MSALPPEDAQSMIAGDRYSANPAASIRQLWTQLHHEADELAAFADLAMSGKGSGPVELPAALAEASGWQRNLAWQSLEDIAAMMQPGMAALRTIAARGNDTTAPAMALWREFHSAREALLAMLDGSQHPETLDAA